MAVTYPTPLSHARPTTLSRFYFGVCYYPEHCPEDTWGRDAQRMAAAHINLARMAEFAWDRMEPEEGRCGDRRAGHRRRSGLRGVPFRAASSGTGGDVHRYLFEQGYATGFVHPQDDLSSVKLYVIPHWAMFDPARLDPIRRWVEAGGTLLIGAMTATRDMQNNIVGETVPGLLSGLAGVTVTDYTRVIGRWTSLLKTAPPRRR